MAEARAVKKQLSMQYWASIIADRKSSGLNIDEYCKENNISRNSYFYWLRQIRENVASSIDSTELSLPLSNAAPGTLVELVPSQSSRKPAVISSVPQISVSPDTEETINILVNGVTIPVRSCTSDELLIKIMRAARNA